MRTNKMFSRRCGRLTWLGVAILTAGLGGAMLSGGCAAVGWAGSALFPPKVDPMYVPAKVPTLVLVENRQNPSMGLAETDELTAYIIDDLKTYQVCPIVDPKKLQELRDQKEKEVGTMTISQIGKAVGAEQVLYVDLRGSNVGAITGVPLHGRVDLGVRLVDVKSAKTLFPKNSVQDYAMSFETPMTTNTDGVDPVAMRTGLLASTGTGVGRLFHEYYPQGR